ncbi:Nuclear valosin-containing protein-like [Lamellibrachia satsuma]|nr:Nuclear valosin-containing protein-like [Lamellibrachia satsuma]
MTLDVQRQETKKDNLNDGSTRTDEHQLSVTDESMDAGTKMRQDKYTTPVTEEAGKSSKSSTGKKFKRKKAQEGEEKEERKKTTRGPEPTLSTVKFADIGGSEAALLEVCKLLVHMKHPEVYQRLGVTPPRGFLLHGPPGCGKTLLAHAIAGELQLPFIKLAATEVVSGVSGESEEKLRDIFNSATATAPCILFLDEIDSITPKRENASKDMERRIVAQLLTCMDDLNSKSTGHVLVIGATNRPDALDPALRRAGRFDREISLGIPDEGARIGILKVLCRDLRLETDFDFEGLAHNTPGYVGADLMALAREAAITAVNRVFQALKSEKETGEVKVDDIVNDDPITQKEAVTMETEKTTEAEKTTSSCETVMTTVPVGDITIRDVTASGVTDINVTVSDVKMDTTNAVNKSASDTDILAVRKSVTMETLDVTMTTKRDIIEELDSVLGWLKDTPPLTDDQLSSLFITMADFNRSEKVLRQSPGVTWDDIGALYDIREELQMAILAPVKHRAQFAALGLTTPPGVLLAGPPGCGKTLLAKAVANESGINFISVKGPELLNMYVGRESQGGEGGASVRVVNQLLTEMDGLEARKQVFVMAATNRPDIIDPAMLRPGRLDKILYVGLPSCTDRADILIAVTKNGTRPRLRQEVCLDSVAADPRCNNFTGADLAALVREAAVAALKEFMETTHPASETPAVGSQHFDVAFRKVKPSVSNKDQNVFAAMKARVER